MAENRLDQLARILRERDMKDAQAREAQRAAALAVEQKKAAAERESERIATTQAVRRGCWLNFLLASADKSAPVDFSKLEVPADPNAWPPGMSPETFSYVPKPKPADTNAPTTLSKLLATHGGLK